jgi:hypothetical protein
MTVSMGKGDALLGLPAANNRRLGVDLHLDVGDVGHGVDGQLLVAEDAQRGHAEHGQQHQPALLDGKRMMRSNMNIAHLP